MIKADDLLVLLEVSRSGSLSGAGKALGIDHSTVSRRLDALDREVGTPVLVRSTSGTRLTARGEELLAAAHLVEEGIALASSGNGAPSRALSGLLRVNSSDAFGATFVAAVLARMQNENPELSVELVTSMRPVMQREDADVEIGVRPSGRADTGTAPIARYTLGLYASESYLAVHAAPTSVAELAEHPAVFYIEPFLRLSALDTLHGILPPHRIRFASTNVFAHLSATAAGGGIGLLPVYLADPDPQLRRLIPEQVSIRFSYYARVTARALARPAASAFLEALVEETHARRAELTGAFESARGD